MTTLIDVIHFIYSQEFSTDDHDRIVAALKDRHRLRQLNARRNFKIGDEVEFDSPRRIEPVRGKITKILRTSIDLDENPSSEFPAAKWRVGPMLLRHVSK